MIEISKQAKIIAGSIGGAIVLAVCTILLVKHSKIGGSSDVTTSDISCDFGFSEKSTEEEDKKEDDANSQIASIESQLNDENKTEGEGKSDYSSDSDSAILDLGGNGN